MRLIRCVICFAIVLFAGSRAWGQRTVEPMTMGMQLIPPYSVCLYDMVAPGSEKLRVQITLRDEHSPPYNFFLVFEIIHQGRLLTRTSASYRPLMTTESRRNLALGGSVVLPYFQEENMDFVGYSRDLYRRTQSFPEGLITIKVTAYDYGRPTLVIGRAQTIAWLAKAEPPLLQTPQNHQQMEAMNDIFPVVFSWLPRNMGSPNSAMETSYRFELFEIMLKGDDPNRVAKSQQPVYVREFNQGFQTSFSYGAADPRLVLGRSYAWRVKAEDRSGRDLFANNGYSAVSMFTYGLDLAILALPPITNVAVKVINNTATLTWQGNAQHGYYVVEYLCKDCQQWKVCDSTDQRRQLLLPLAWDVEYEARVTAFNGARRSLSTTPVKFVCKEPSRPNCDDASGSVLPFDPHSPLLKSLPYDTEISDNKGIHYVIKGSKLNGNNTFEGGAVMYLSFGNFGGKAGIPVRTIFKNLSVNEDLRKVGGTFHYVSAKGGMADFDAYFEGETTGSGHGTSQSDMQLSIALSQDDNITVAPGSSEGMLALTITNADGSTQTVEVPVPANAKSEDAEPTLGNSDNAEVPDLAGTTVTDANGSTFALQPNGSGGYTPKPVSTKAAPPKTDFTVVDNRVAIINFEVDNAADAPYLSRFEGAYTASHLIGERHLSLTYAQPQSGKKNYYAPVLSVNPGSSITVRAVAGSEQKIALDSIFFSTQEGERLSATLGKDYLTLTLTSGTEGESRRYYAIFPQPDGKQVVVGALEVVTYAPKTTNVVLVPVNEFGIDIDVQEVQNYLNNIYRVANVNFSVSKAADFSYNGNLKLLENGSGLLSAYTEDMKALNNAYAAKLGDDFKNDALYLFISNYSGGTDSHAAGFMPRQQQMGYIFLADAGKDINRIIAHELGHGSANLAHTFDATKYGIPQGTTANLMDYNSGTELVKLQWDALHNPGEVWRVFERDKDAMASWTIIDKRHTELFNYIYDKNLNPYKTGTGTYRAKNWSEPWTYGDDNSNDLVDKVITKLKNTANGKIVPKIKLRNNGIYIGKHTVAGKEYATAIYCRKEEIGNIKKVMVSELKKLQTDSIKKHLYCESTYAKYLVLAFYEDGESEPVLMIQAAKNEFEAFSDKHLEAWMKYVGVMGTETAQSATAPQLLPWMNYAIAEAKTMNGVSECDEPLFSKGTMYHKQGGHNSFCPCGQSNDRNYCDPSAWCASFANWCLRQSSTEYTKSAGSQTFLSHSGLVKISEPVFGAIAVFTNLDDAGNFTSSGHVAFVVGKIGGTHVLCLGGNQSNTIKVSSYSLDSDKKNMRKKSYFRGYYIPKTHSDKLKDYKTMVEGYSNAEAANQQIINLIIKQSENESTR